MGNDYCSGVKLTAMSSEPSATAARGAAVGLCASCRHHREVRNTRGSVFHLCERSRSDSSYPRYPRLPVLSCRGYERAAR
jgi:hypothetical protein